MAKVFDLVKESGFNALASAITGSNTQIKQDVSNYLLGNLQHFRANGKKVDVLQRAVDFLLTERYRDYEVIATAIKFLTPIKFNTEAANGRKKWINIEGEAAAKEGAKESQIKDKLDQNRARWSNSFEKFATGGKTLVDDPRFYKGCNDNKPAAEHIPAKKEEDFSQDIYFLCDRLAAIRVEAQLLADERNGATSDNTIALSLGYGSVKTSFDGLSKKLVKQDELITVEYVSGASNKELESLTSYTDEMEKVIATMQAKLDAVKARVSGEMETRANNKAREEEEETLRKAGEIMQRRTEEAANAEEVAA